MIYNMEAPLLPPDNDDCSIRSCNSVRSNRSNRSNKSNRNKRSKMNNNEMSFFPEEPMIDTISAVNYKTNIHSADGNFPPQIICSTHNKISVDGGSNSNKNSSSSNRSRRPTGSNHYSATTESDYNEITAATTAKRVSSSSFKKLISTYEDNQNKNEKRRKQGDDEWHGFVEKREPDHSEEVVPDSPPLVGILQAPKVKKCSQGEHHVQCAAAAKDSIGLKDVGNGSGEGGGSDTFGTQAFIPLLEPFSPPQLNTYSAEKATTMSVDYEFFENSSGEGPLLLIRSNSSSIVSNRRAAALTTRTPTSKDSKLSGVEWVKFGKSFDKATVGSNNSTKGCNFGITGNKTVVPLKSGGGVNRKGITDYDSTKKEYDSKILANQTALSSNSGRVDRKATTDPYCYNDNTKEYHYKIPKIQTDVSSNSGRIDRIIITNLEGNEPEKESRERTERMVRDVSNSDREAGETRTTTKNVDNKKAQSSAEENFSGLIPILDPQNKNADNIMKLPDDLAFWTWDCFHERTTNMDDSSMFPSPPSVKNDNEATTTTTTIESNLKDIDSKKAEEGITMEWFREDQKRLFESDPKAESSSSTTDWKHPDHYQFLVFGNKDNNDEHNNKNSSNNINDSCNFNLNPFSSGTTSMEWFQGHHFKNSPTRATTAIENETNANDGNSGSSTNVETSKTKGTAAQQKPMLSAIFMGRNISAPKGDEHLNKDADGLSSRDNKMKGEENDDTIIEVSRYNRKTPNKKKKLWKIKNIFGKGINRGTDRIMITDVRSENMKAELMGDNTMNDNVEKNTRALEEHSKDGNEIVNISDGDGDGKTKEDLSGDHFGLVGTVVAWFENNSRNPNEELKQENTVERGNEDNQQSLCGALDGSVFSFPLSAVVCSDEIGSNNMIGYTTMGRGTGNLFGEDEWISSVKSLTIDLPAPIGKMRLFENNEDVTQDDSNGKQNTPTGETTKTTTTTTSKSALETTRSFPFTFRQDCSWYYHYYN